jgi:hypothetical protein
MENREDFIPSVMVAGLVPSNTTQTTAREEPRKDGHPEVKKSGSSPRKAPPVIYDSPKWAALVNGRN